MALDTQAGSGSAGSNGAGEVGHQAMIYRSGEELVAGAAPFLRAGIAADDPVLVVLDADHRALLCNALGPDAAAVEWAEPGSWYTFPAHTLYGAHQFAQRHPGRTPRLMGEVVWAGRSAAEIAEWTRYEALLSLAFPAIDMLCAYDAAVCNEAVLATATHTHPVLREATTTAPSAAFLDPPAFLTACDAAPLPAPPGSGEALGFGPNDLRAVRGYVTARAAAAGLDPARAEDLVTAVSEATTNAVEHGPGGHGVLWIWSEAGRLVCEVTNPAGLISDPLAGYLPPDPLRARGRGLWFMRQLTDLVELRSDPRATTVRLHMWL